MNYIIIVMCLFMSSCSLPSNEVDGFQYQIYGQEYRQIKYRSVEQDNLYKFHTGVRTIKFDNSVYTTVFQNYYEYTVAPCYGTVIGAISEVDEDAFLLSIGEAGVDQTDSNNNGVYDIFEPYSSGTVTSGTSSDQAEVLEKYFIIDVTENNLTAGCSILQETRQYFQIILYQNGDLILRDYNREIEFFFRPVN